MAGFRVLQDGAEVPPSGVAAPLPNTFAISGLVAPAPRTRFPLGIQWQDEGVNAGEPNVRVVNIITDPLVYTASRGAGEKSNVITIGPPPPRPPVSFPPPAPPPPPPAPPPGPPTDPMFADVLLLMAGDSTSDDLSPHNRLIIGGGGAGGVGSNPVTVSTDHLVFGQPMLKVPSVAGGSSSLNVSYGSGSITPDDLALDSRDFSIEFFQWVDVSPGGNAFQPTAITQGSFLPLLWGSGIVDFTTWSVWAGFNTSTGTFAFKMNTGVPIARGVLQFVQLIRSGSTFTFALDGVVVGTATFSGSIDAPPTASGSYVFCTNQGFVTQHYIAQYRVTRGVRPIEIPTAPWPIV